MNLRSKDKPKILVLEDELPLLEVIGKKLQLSGFDILRGRSVQEGATFLTQDPVDVIWLDHYLLGASDGLDFVAQVKHRQTWRNIPIFVVSNTASPEKKQTYLRLGVSKYYTKADHRIDEIIGDIKTTIKAPQ